jgi:lysophospholipase L1-like esterase
MSTGSDTRPGYLRLVIGNVLVACLIVICLEGVASYVVVLGEILSTRPVAERLHTKYDPELGWVNKPNVDIPDMYGPGISLRTNSQGFRADHDFDPVVAPGKRRIVCSGDSFTLGYGVSNEHTWCHLLTSLNPQFETVNMGQGGYGVDQAYLWYKRDGLALNHELHVLAFITLDFYRMQQDEFLGYGKPVLEIENGSLAVRNVPVPERVYRPWLTAGVQSVKRLRTLDLMTELLSGRGPRAAVPSSNDRTALKTRQILDTLLQDLRRRDEARGIRLIMVYLPQFSELKGEGPREWIDFLEGESKSYGIPLINVVDTFRRLTDAEADAMFIREGQLAYRGAAGHLTNQGNRLVAEVIYNGLENGWRAAQK